MPGLLIDSITPAGQADKIGLRRHDVLYKYNNALLNNTEDLITATRSMKAENKLLVIRGRELLNFNVTPSTLGVAILPYPAPDIHIDGVGEVLARFRYEDESETIAAREARLSQIASIQVTTVPSLEGYRVINTLGIVTAEYVAGINFLRDFLSEITDVIGGRSGSLQNELREARETCIANLKMEAHHLGANAVIGIDLDYSEISGNGKSMLFLVASGTAVIVEKYN